MESRHLTLMARHRRAAKNISMRQVNVGATDKAVNRTLTRRLAPPSGRRSRGIDAGRISCRQRQRRDRPTHVETRPKHIAAMILIDMVKWYTKCLESRPMRCAEKC